MTDRYNSHGAGEITVRAKPGALAMLLCNASHPTALAFGLVPPLVPCCRHCTIFPQVFTAATFPA
jgi:hypothetical protein